MVAARQPDKKTISAAVLLALALLFGGGGSPAPMPELVLQVVSALVFGVWLYRQPEGLRIVPRPVWWIAGMLPALHLMQLVPLPPALWHSLPGRSGQFATLELVSAGQSWRPLSLSPSRTVASLLCVLSALSVLLITSTLSIAARWQLIQITAVAGLATLIVGVLQLKGELGSLLNFYNAGQAWLSGFQANRNSTADVILIAMLAGAAVLWHQEKRLNLPPLLIGASIVILDFPMSAALFLTGSRTGLVLLPLVLIAQFVILQSRRKQLWHSLFRWVAGAIALTAIALTALHENRAVAATMARFTLEGEFRPELWRDALFALGRYWPIGAGQGTFVPVMIAAERLEVVDPTIPNRAHNDFLELAIEGGAPALLVLLAIGAILLRAAWQALRQQSGDGRVQALFAAPALGLLAIHSLVDYPFRSMTLSTLAAAAAGMLFSPQARRSGLEEAQA